MIIYIKLGKIRGLSLDLNKNFGSRPIFQKNSLHGETIIDIPFGQIIYTPSNWKPIQIKAPKSLSAQKLPIRRASNVNSQSHQTTKRARRANGD